MSTAGLCDEIVYLTVGDADLIKQISFACPDLDDDETVASIDDITIYETDQHWENPQVSSDITVVDNGQSGQYAEVLISADTAGFFRADITVITSLSQAPVAQCRIKVEA